MGLTDVDGLATRANVCYLLFRASVGQGIGGLSHLQQAAREGIDGQGFTSTSCSTPLPQTNNTPTSQSHPNPVALTTATTKPRSHTTTTPHHVGPAREPTDGGRPGPRYRRQGQGQGPGGRDSRRVHGRRLERRVWR